jgi:protein-S-isoprenylcysteine O-methyltransferase Ste14
MEPAPACIVTVALVILLDPQARREARWLRETFASYAAYAQRVRRLIPWVY